MTKPPIVRYILALSLALALASGGRAGAEGFGAGPIAQLSPDGAAAAYCSQVGGKPLGRYPIYGSNSSENLRLAGSRTFCQFTSPSDGSRIHILVETLYTTLPSLVALAYYAAPALGSCKGNPASCYCSQLGGSDVFGGPDDPAGGGWYNKKSVDQTLEACIFPDMSSIDSWGLAYHSAGIVRGIDLSTVMRFQNPYSNKRR
jgi:putative hemolysin